MNSATGRPALEIAIARLLTWTTYAVVAVLVVGVVLMLAAGRHPLDPAPALDLTRLPADLVALRPEGFLWLGLVATMLTPAARVVASLVGYLRRTEIVMAAVAAGVLVVIAVGVVAGDWSGA